MVKTIQQKLSSTAALILVSAAFAACGKPGSNAPNNGSPANNQGDQTLREAVLRDGKPTRFDAAATLAEASEAAARLARESRDTVERAEAFRPGLTAMVRRILSADHGPCRLARLS